MGLRRFVASGDLTSTTESSSIRNYGGIVLLIATLMLFLYRRNLQSVNILFVLLTALWLSIRLLSKTTLFTKNERDLTTPSRKRYAKLLSLLLLGFVVFILISATLFLNLSQQVGGEAGEYESSNYGDEAFKNLIPTSVSSENSSFFATLANYMVGDSQRSPDTVLPTKEFVLEPLDLDEISVTWFGHSTLLIRSNNVTILTDPLFGEGNTDPLFFGPTPFTFEYNYALEDLPPIDYVLISHDHYDHLDHRTIQALDDRVPLYVVPLGVGAHLQFWGVPPERIIERDWWGEVKQGGLTITATPGRHFSGRSLVMTDQNKTLWAGWVIAGPEHSVYYSGDTGMFPGFSAIGQRLGPFDAVLIETGAYNSLWRDVHLGPEQAIEARLALGSGLVIPVHWGTFNLGMHAWTEPVERLLVAAKKAGIQLVTPRPGESVEPATPPPVSRWWPELPWRTSEQSPLVASGLGDSLSTKDKTIDGDPR